MLKNYWVTAIRTLQKNGLYTFITVFGLAVGLSSSLIILQFVRSELAFDRWVPWADRIAVFESEFAIPGRELMKLAGAPGPAMAALQKDFPGEIEAATRTFARRPLLKRGTDVFRERVHMVDPTFFDVFDLPLLAGDRESALGDDRSIILSKDLAEKYFGTEDPIGQTLELNDNRNPRTVRVTGIMADPRPDASFRWRALIRFEESSYEDEPWIAKQWTSVNSELFVKMTSREALTAVNGDLPAFEERNIPNMAFNGKDFAIHEFLTLRTVPLPEYHLFSTEQSESGAYVWVLTFGVVALLIIFIACVNFVNLSTARASQRAREVALRKVVGASRTELVVQFLGESLLLTALSLLVGLALTEVSLPWFSTWLDRPLQLTYLGAGSILPWLLALLLGVGLGAGLYPALYLSRFKPSAVLKANRSTTGGSTARLRAALVTLQFAVSIGLMICTAVVVGQAYYAVNKDLGYRKDGILVVRGMGRKETQAKADFLRERALSIPGVLGATLSSDVPTDDNENNLLVQVPGRTQEQPLVFGRLIFGPDFRATYGIDLVAGRDFDRDRQQDVARSLESSDWDSTRTLSVMVNEAAVRALGHAQPDEAIGAQVEISTAPGKTINAEIVGVIDDFHYFSVRKQIRPCVYLNVTDAYWDLSVRYAGVSVNRVRDALEAQWNQVAPGIPFRAQILEGLLWEQYEREVRVAQIFGFFAVLAIVIACLGLYGLAAFTAARRTREIGIRKVLGATVWDIVRLMVWQLSRPALWANLVAWPVAFLIMRWWLEGFFYRISLNPALFFVAGFVAIAIAWLTVVRHAHRVSMTSPASALRYE